MKVTAFVLGLASARGFLKAEDEDFSMCDDYGIDGDDWWCSGTCEEYGDFDCKGTGESWACSGDDWACWGEGEDYECEGFMKAGDDFSMCDDYGIDGDDWWCSGTCEEYGDFECMGTGESWYCSADGWECWGEGEDYECEGVGLGLMMAGDDFEGCDDYGVDGEDWWCSGTCEEYGDFDCSGSGDSWECGFEDFSCSGYGEGEWECAGEEWNCWGYGEDYECEGIEWGVMKAQRAASNGRQGGHHPQQPMDCEMECDRYGNCW